MRGDDEQAARSNEELDRIAHSLYSVYYQIGQHHQITIGDIKAQYKRCDGGITTVKKLLEKFNSFKFNGQNGKTGKTTKYKYMLAERRFLDMLRSRYGKEDIGLYRLSPVTIEDYFQYLKNFKGQNNNTACCITCSMISSSVRGRSEPSGLMATPPPACSRGVPSASS